MSLPFFIHSLHSIVQYYLCLYTCLCCRTFLHCECCVWKRASNVHIKLPTPVSSTVYAFTTGSPCSLWVHYSNCCNNIIVILYNGCAHASRALGWPSVMHHWKWGAPGYVYTYLTDFIAIETFDVVSSIQEFPHNVTTTPECVNTTVSCYGNTFTLWLATIPTSVWSGVFKFNLYHGSHTDQRKLELDKSSIAWGKVTISS